MSSARLYEFWYRAGTSVELQILATAQQPSTNRELLAYRIHCKEVVMTTQKGTSKQGVLQTDGAVSRRTTLSDNGELPLRPFGSTSLRVTPICVGCAPLASMPEVFYPVSEQEALAVLRTVFQSPINLSYQLSAFKAVSRQLSAVSFEG